MKKIQSILPFFFSSLFVVSIIGCSHLKLSEVEGTPYYVITWAFIILYTIWIFLESRLGGIKREEKSKEADLGSFEIYALSRALVVLSGLVVPMIQRESLVFPLVGMLIFVVFVVFRLLSLRHRVDPHNGPETDSIVRHPAYTGMIFAHLGYAIFFFNYVTLSLWAFFHVPAVVFRILIQERSLTSHRDFVDNAQNKKRLIPFVW